MKIILFFLILLNSCGNDNEGKADKQSAIFSSYLKTNFNEDLPEQLHYYILISKFRCTGCVEKNLNELVQFISEKNYKNFTFITSDLNIIPKKLAERIVILYDKEDKLEYLNLDIANLTLIENKGQKLIFLKSFNPEDTPVTEYINL